MQLWPVHLHFPTPNSQSRKILFPELFAESIHISSVSHYLIEQMFKVDKSSFSASAVRHPQPNSTHLKSIVCEMSATAVIKKFCFRTFGQQDNWTNCIAGLNVLSFQSHPAQNRIQTRCL
jgi:hypothetical protein